MTTNQPVIEIDAVTKTYTMGEVGLRKAVGAKRGDILLQFLAEAIVLSVLGGLLGVALGIGGAQVLTPLLGSSQARLAMAQAARAAARPHAAERVADAVLQEAA